MTSYCSSTTNTCSCITGYAENSDNSSCILNKIGSQCDSSDPTDCSVAVTYSTCSSNSTCECLPGYYTASNNTECLRYYINSHCYDTPNCAASVASSECSNMYCACVQGYIAEGIETCRVMTVEDPCNSTIQCQTAVNNSYCGSNATCDCLSGYASRYNGSACYRNNITSPCTMDSDCYDVMLNSSCVSQQCACDMGFHVAEGNTSCSQNHIHDMCNQSPDCDTVIDSSYCDSTTDTCLCQAGYAVNAANDTCTLRQIGSQCNPSIPVECSAAVTFSTCASNGTCACLAGYYATHSNANCTRYLLNTACSDSPNCAASIPNSKCSAGVCSCMLGYIPSGDTRCTQITVEDPCNSTVQCQTFVNNSYCGVNNTCECYSGYASKLNGTSCYSNNITSPCTIDSQCWDSIQNSSCVNMQCQCDAGLYPSQLGTQCTPYQIGDTHPCNSTASVDDCTASVQHSSCYNSTCLCDRGYRPSTDNTTCTLLTLHVGCTSWDQACETAIGNSTCVTG